MDVSSSVLSGNPVCLVLGVETNAPSVGNWTQELVSGGGRPLSRVVVF